MRKTEIPAKLHAFGRLFSLEGVSNRLRFVKYVVSI